MAHKFEITRDKAGEYRVRFKYNSETIFSTEGYSSKVERKECDRVDQEKRPRRGNRRQQLADPAVFRSEPCGRRQAASAGGARFTFRGEIVKQAAR